jgi:hypothetical protein
MADSNAILTKVRALLDKAESTEFAQEANLYRAKAEELMAKYRIEEEELIAKDATAVMPIYGDTPLASVNSDYYVQYYSLFYWIAKHVGIRAKLEWGWDTGDRKVWARTVGYEADLRYAEVLFTNARMVFAERLEPAINHSLSDQENVYRLRASGMERVRIARMMWGEASKANLSRVGAMYKRECAKRGEEPALSGRGVTGKEYREQYAEQFVETLRVRLAMARDAAGRAGGGLVLHGRQERVDEAFYARFPSERPKAAIESDRSPATTCQKCAKAKSGFCNEHRPSYGRVSTKNPYSAAAVRGRAAGSAAARHVDLGRGGTGSLGGA